MSRRNSKPFLLKWSPTEWGHGGSYWSTALIDQMEFEVDWINYHQRYDISYRPSPGSKWEKVIPEPGVQISSLDDAKRYVEDHLLPPLVRLLLETKENPRLAHRKTKPFLLKWSPTEWGHGGNYWSTAVIDQVEYEVDWINHHQRYDIVFRPGRGGKWEKVYPEPGVTISSLDDAKRYVEDYLLPPLVRLLLETKENPGPESRNTKLLLDWQSPHPGDYFIAGVPGYGMLSFDSKRRYTVCLSDPGFKFLRTFMLPVELRNTPGGKGDVSWEHVAAWAEENCIPPMIRLLLETKENPKLARRNGKLLLDWNQSLGTSIGQGVWYATVPGYGRYVFKMPHIVNNQIYSLGIPVTVKDLDPNARFAKDAFVVPVDPAWTSKEDVFRWIEENHIPPMIRLLLETKENPHRSRSFTPSYEAETKEEYEAKVRDGSKRLLHVQIHGGRKATAGHDTDIPRMKPETKTRLARQLPPWDARTQSPESHGQATARQLSKERKPAALEQQIRQAIQNYRDQNPAFGAIGFAVPSSVDPLLKAGMPYKPAAILVARARNAFYPVVGVPEIQKLILPTVESLILGALKAPLSFRAVDGRLVIPGTSDQRRERVVSSFLVEEDGTRARVMGSKEIQDLYMKHRDKIQKTGEDYRREVDDPQVVAQLMSKLSTRYQSYMTKPNVKGLIVLKSLDREEVIPFSLGEHSTLSEQEASPKPIEYRSLRNVDLDSLPPLLASLSTRKRRVGRRLKEL